MVAGGSVLTLALAWGAMSAGVWFPIGSLLAGLWGGSLAIVGLQIHNLRQHDEDLSAVLDLTVQHADEVEGQLVEDRSEEHTSELQSLTNLVCRLLLEKKKHYPQSEPLHSVPHQI